MAAVTPASSWKEQLRGHLLAPRLTWNDRLMLVLAALDIVLLAVRRDIPLPAEWQEPVVAGIHTFDLVVVGIFAVEFLASLAVAKQRGAFLKGNWYDLVGLIPLHNPIVRAFRLGRLVRVFVWGSRFPDDVRSKYGGEPYMLTVLRRYEPVLLEELTDPLLTRLLKVLRRAVERGRYVNAVGESLGARRDELHAVVVDAIQRSPALALAYNNVPPVRAGVDEVQRQTLDVAIGALTDPRLDHLIRQAIDDALAGLEKSIAEKEWAREGAAVPRA